MQFLTPYPASVISVFVMLIMFQMLAKLACGFHKPNKQTVLPHSEVPQLFATLPVRKM